MSATMRLRGGPFTLAGRDRATPGERFTGRVAHVVADPAAENDAEPAAHRAGASFTTAGVGQ